MKERVLDIFSAVAFGFFGRVFFALIGIQFNAQYLISAIPLFVSLLVVAVLGKIGGGNNRS